MSLETYTASLQNVSSVHVGPERVWKPDIRFFNSEAHEDYEATDVVVRNNGFLFWVPPVTSHTFCEGLDLTYWPWDIQQCEILIGSWTKNGWQLDTVIMGNTKANVSDVGDSTYEGSHWDLVQARAVRE